MEKRKLGFTLIELLVVVAIIGLLLSVVSISLSNSRQKSRDAKRLADMHQVKTGLDLYFNTGYGYPDEGVWNPSQSSQTMLTCSGIETFRVPNDIFVGSGYSYTYTAGGTSYPGCGGTVWSTYKVRFQTEGNTSIGPVGVYYLHPGGITTTAPF